MRLALFQPDIAANAGAILRLGACLSVPVDMIEPCGFVFSDRSLRRAGMDYLDIAHMTRHASWEAFLASDPARIVLMTTKGDAPLGAFEFRAGDTLLLGRESAGVPDDVHRRADARVVIPMAPGARSLNIALAAAIGLGEALRQTRSAWTKPA
jgi:tRNA (cytidine/uridine-2'-O-)-methyltransferase